MKTYPICIIALIALTPTAMRAQSSEVIDMKKHKIIMQFNDSDSISQVRVTQQVRNVKTSWPNAEVEVVCLGGGLDMLMTTTSKVSPLVADLTSKGVIFAACNNTMRFRNIKKEELLKQAVVVPAAVVEISTKQEEGWSYFKSGK